VKQKDVLGPFAKGTDSGVHESRLAVNECISNLVKQSGTILRSNLHHCMSMIPIAMKLDFRGYGEMLHSWG